MTTLPTQLRIGGFDLRQIERRGQWAVFEQSKGGRVVAFELIRVQVLPAGRIMGRDYPEREVYPRSELWGEHGWTIRDRGEALERLFRLTPSSTVTHLTASEGQDSGPPIKAPQIGSWSVPADGEK